MYNVHVKETDAMLGKIIFCAACVCTTVLVLLLLLILPDLPYRVPLYVAARVSQRVKLLQPGMTEQAVWSTLGLSGRGFKAHISGSGPSNAFPANYVLRPDYVLHVRWNYRTRPATLVEAEFRHRL